MENCESETHDGGGGQKKEKKKTCRAISCCHDGTDTPTHTLVLSR